MKLLQQSRQTWAFLPLCPTSSWHYLPSRLKVQTKHFHPQLPRALTQSYHSINNFWINEQILYFSKSTGEYSVAVLDGIPITSASVEIFDENQQMLVPNGLPCGPTPPCIWVSGSSSRSLHRLFVMQDREGSECPDQTCSPNLPFSNLHTEGDTCIITSPDSMSSNSMTQCKGR